MSIPVISIAQMREWEQASWAAGKSEAEVIHQVGKALAREALLLTKDNDTILILAGKGHNGDDARCAREHLPERHVRLLDVRHAETDTPKIEAALKARPALVIDGLFGVGLNRPLNDAWIKLIELINASKLPVLAVDVPSGLNADSGEAQGAAIEATVTLTVGAPKLGMVEHHATNYVGQLVVARDIGLVEGSHESHLNWTVPEDFRDFPPRRPVEGHKGTFGHLAIIAGSRGYHGAAVLAARGAQRAQPGLITLFPQENICVPVASQLQSTMVHPWSPKTELPGKFNAVLIGPGLAAPDVSEELKDAARRLWREAEAPVIADANALNWLPNAAGPKDSVRVITPHPGEAARLLNISAADVQTDRLSAIREISRQFDNIWVVLKGNQTLVGRCDDPIFINSSGNPFLGQGGSGDTLSGYLAGLLAQRALQEDPALTIRYAVWQHGAAADLLTRTKPNWIVEDLIETLGSVR
jgi:hydroxyethylthiazole kinase-like uncharacterized protein yjeF